MSYQIKLTFCITEYTLDNGSVYVSGGKNGSILKLESFGSGNLKDSFIRTFECKKYE